jgi:hypothetical protein
MELSAGDSLTGCFLVPATWHTGLAAARRFASLVFHAFRVIINDAFQHTDLLIRK